MSGHARLVEGDCAVVARLALEAAAQVMDQHAESWRAAERDLIGRHGPNNLSTVYAQVRGQTWERAAEMLRKIATNGVIS